MFDDRCAAESGMIKISVLIAIYAVDKLCADSNICCGQALPARNDQE